MLLYKYLASSHAHTLESENFAMIGFFKKIIVTDKNAVLFDVSVIFVSNISQLFVYYIQENDI